LKIKNLSKVETVAHRWNFGLTGHPVRDPSAGGETLTAMAEARQLAADPGAKRYDDIDELFNDALK